MATGMALSSSAKHTRQLIHLMKPVFFIQFTLLSFLWQTDYKAFALIFPHPKEKKGVGRRRKYPKRVGIRVGDQ
jgi:hypothetical protein